MALSQEYIDRQQALAKLVTQYKSEGVDHNQAWKKAEQYYDSGQYAAANNAAGGSTGSSTTAGGSTGSSTGSQNVRYRDSDSWSRVGSDTRVRQDAGNNGSIGKTDSGMGAALQSATGKQFANADKTVQPVQRTATTGWENARKSTSVAGVQARLKNLLG